MELKKIGMKELGKPMELKAHSVTNIILSITIVISGFFLRNAYNDLNSAIDSLVKITGNIEKIIGIMDNRLNQNEKERNNMASDIKEIKDTKIVNIENELKKLRLQLQEVKTKQDMYHNGRSNG